MKLSPEEYHASLNKKPMAAGALIFDESERILIVSPNYEDGWLIPGGMVEKDESPRQGCIRELKEELGLLIVPKRLLCIDYKVNRGIYETLQFVFDGGTLDIETIGRIKLQTEELKEFGFFPMEEALKLLSSRMSARMEKCLKAKRENTCVYLEKGEEV